MKAMILAAGLGTRLKPLTDTKPKVLIEINGISMLEHQVNYLRYYGVNEIIINVHHFAEQVKDFFRQKKFGCRIEFSDETDQLLETGGGLKKASWFFDDGKPFILIGSDIFTNLDLNQLIDFHKTHSPIATLAVKKRKTSRELLIDEKNYLCGWRNNITGEEIKSRDFTKVENYGFSVVHIIDPRIFDQMEEQGTFSMMPFYLRIAAKYPVMGFIHDQSEWYEFGRLENFNDKDFINKAGRIIKFYQT